MDYAFTHKGKAFTPNQTKIDASQAESHNAEIEAQEISAWQAKPDRWIGYIVKGALTTWRGVKLGDVIASNYSRNPLTGSKIHHVRVRGTNGAMYHGKYGSDWGQAVKLTKCK